MKSMPLMLSGIVLTHNEQATIASCLKSLSFCNEIIVIDDFSTDKTVEISKKHKARIYKRKLNKSFAKQRNFALKKANGTWVLFIDADEKVPLDLQLEIKKAIDQKNAIKGYYLRRVDVLWNKVVTHGELGKYGAFGNGLILRLAKNNSGVWKRDIHEVWDIKGKTAELTSTLLHYPHQTLFEFIKDIGERSALHAEVIKREGKKISVIKVILWPLGKFIYNFIFKLGFLDGIRGFILAVMMSFHSFISWSSLWLQTKQ